MNSIFVVFFILVGFFEVMQLIRKRLLRELIALSVLLVFGITVSTLYAFGIDLPSPITAAKTLIEDVLRIAYI